jgi:hypothetical protein
MENLVIGSIVHANVAAGTGEDWYWTQPLEGEWYLETAYYVPGTTRATDAANYTTMALKQGATTLGSLTNNSTGGAAFTAGTARAFTLSGGNDRQLGKGDVLILNKADTGTGTALDGTLSFSLHRIA